MCNVNENKYQKKILTIPNVLSFFRICLIPVIVWLYCVKEDYLWTTIVLMISGITDIVDGFIARHFGMISDFEKAFDPIADKLTQAVTLYCLVTRFPLMMLPLVVLVVKEVFAGITALLRIKKTNKVPMAVWHGKVTTLSLYGMMLIHLERVPQLCYFPQSFMVSATLRRCWINRKQIIDKQEMKVMDNVPIINRRR